MRCFRDGELFTDSGSVPCIMQGPRTWASLDSTQSLSSLFMSAWLPDSHVTGNTHAVFPGRRAFYRLRQRSLHYAGTTDLGRFSAHQHRIYQGFRLAPLITPKEYHRPAIYMRHSQIYAQCVN
ncbi:hypothetical protein NDU88_002268 [Pleurodeles waltl]|uniref:Uncharacterized protein n=1 Tax=Pleurodeles waltl TaxID=8319 RepID=A0AAV7LBW4_PLEWA|nr:hypothetical protein NDU88_002268 [Pleurodeles waltl]